MEAPPERAPRLDLQDGIHRNPDPAGRPEWSTLAYPHRPEELREEVAAAGFGASAHMMAVARRPPGRHDAPRP